MSRSYKKHECHKIKDKEAHKQANRRWRKTYSMEDAQYSKYKRYAEQWDIIDASYFCSWKEYWEWQIRWYYRREFLCPRRENKYPDKKEEYRNWRKAYKNK